MCIQNESSFSLITCVIILYLLCTDCAAHRDFAENIYKYFKYNKCLFLFGVNLVSSIVLCVFVCYIDVCIDLHNTCFFSGQILIF